MGGFAVVKGGVVINTIIWNGKDDVDFGTDVKLVEYTIENPAGIGYSYKKEKFTPPKPTEDDSDLLWK